jgi:hypothetical protein
MVGVLLLTSCSLPDLLGGAGGRSDPSGQSESPQQSASPTSLPTDTGLGDALGRVKVPGEGPTVILYSNRVEIAGLVEEDRDLWGNSQALGSGGLVASHQQFHEDLGIDILGADRMITVGQAPQQVTLLVGGQVAEDITEKARGRGWAGDPILAREWDLADEPLSAQAPRLRADGEDVAIGGVSADLTTVLEHGETSSSPTLVDDEDVAELVACLGDPLAAVVDLEGDVPLAIGVDAEGKDVRTRICVSGEDAEGTAARIAEDVENGTDRRNIPYSEIYGSASTAPVSGGSAAVDLENTDGTPSSAVFDMYFSRDLPGLGE